MKTTGAIFLSQLAGDQKWYSAGAIAMAFKRNKRVVLRQIDVHLGVGLKQRKYRNGYVYAHKETPDDAPVVYVRMAPQLTIDNTGSKALHNSRE